MKLTDEVRRDMRSEAQEWVNTGGVGSLSIVDAEALLELLDETERLKSELRAATLGWSREADPHNAGLRRARAAAGLNPDPLTDYDNGLVGEFP